MTPAQAKDRDSSRRLTTVTPGCNVEDSNRNHRDSSTMTLAETNVTLAETTVTLAETTVTLAL